MATGRSPREFPEKKHHYDRHRTFSSTTTDHYKNKLAQIGIQKDLREILERKKLQREQEQDTPKTSQPLTDENNVTSSRKVRFEEDNVSVRRSKSFTGNTKFSENRFNNQSINNHITESNFRPSQQSFSKNYREKNFDCIDLLHPTNIKIELKTDSGDRKCMVDSSRSISSIKCDLRSSRNILKHLEKKVSDAQKPENEITNNRFIGRGRGRNNRQARGKTFSPNKESRESSTSVEETFSKLSIGVHSNE